MAIALDQAYIISAYNPPKHPITSTSLVLAQPSVHLIRAKAGGQHITFSQA